MKNWIYSLGFLAILFVIWEVASRNNEELLFILPPPSSIFLKLYYKSDRFLFHTLITLKEMVGGMAVAFAAAFPLAYLMMRFQLARLTFQPLFVLIQCIPMFTLAPIMVIWFGWSYTAIVIPTALMIFFPLTLNIYQGLRSTPQDLLDLFRAHNASWIQTFIKLRLPYSLPHIFAGFRISAAIAGIGAVAGEWAGGQGGLGLFMQETRRNSDLQATFGALFCLATLSLIFYGSIALIEKFSLKLR